jgi:hypothetical protein
MARDQADEALAQALLGEVISGSLVKNGGPPCERAAHGEKRSASKASRNRRNLK